MSSTLNSKIETNLADKKIESPTSSQVIRKKKSKIGFLKKVGIGCKLAFLRLRAVTDDIFVTDEVVAELFEEEDPDSLFDRIERSQKGYSTGEERFLEHYKKYSDLDKMHEHLKSDEDEQKKKAYSLEDVVKLVVSFPKTDDDDYDDKISFTELDFHALREEIEIKEHFENSTDDSSKTTVDPTVNVGETLWEYRRHKWLVPKRTPEEISQHIAEQSIEHIPKELYSKVYSSLVDKGKTLKEGKRINLKDMVEVINRGWIAEEKWERAARGLA